MDAIHSSVFSTRYTSQCCTINVFKYCKFISIPNMLDINLLPTAAIVVRHILQMVLMLLRAAFYPQMEQAIRVGAKDCLWM